MCTLTDDAEGRIFKIAMAYLFIISAVGALAVAAFVLRRKNAKPLMVCDWEKDHVYLIQYPRARVIPQYSPWSLKLETWLRMSGLPFTNVSNGLTRFSAKGQVPFIELNGREIADSNFIIKRLKEMLNPSMDSGSAEEVAVGQAISVLAEDKLCLTLFALRCNDNSFLLSDKGWARHFETGWKKLLRLTILNPFLVYIIRGRLMANGIRRHSDDEIVEIAKDGFKTLTILLGDKPYFMGDKPGTADATVFGSLAAYVYCPTPNGILKDHIKNEHKNLYGFFERVKTTYWPDWEETCRTMDMNTHKKNAKSS